MVLYIESRAVDVRAAAFLREVEAFIEMCHRAQDLQG
jgi:hypothetical protein